MKNGHSRRVKFRLQQVLLGWVLIVAVGGHWPLLQSVAWVNMLVTYSQKDDFRTAVSKTFDGQHPCRICAVVAKGKEAEQERDANKSHLKIDFFLVTMDQLLLRRPVAKVAEFDSPLIGSFPARPPFPPPKSA